MDSVGLDIFQQVLDLRRLLNLLQVSFLPYKDNGKKFNDGIDNKGTIVCIDNDDGKENHKELLNLIFNLSKGEEHPWKESLKDIRFKF